MVHNVAITVILTAIAGGCTGSAEENRLLSNLFRGYQALVRPVRSVNDSALIVKMGLQLVLLIGVDERNQIMHTNLWLTLVWQDYQMTWDPQEFDNIDTVRVPPDKVWLPDIVLFNNADGNYEVTYQSNVVIKHHGEMLWVPPAIYKSSCIIDVEHFPFDEQDCVMNFGSWTFHKNEVVLDFNKNVEAVDLTQFYASSIWDVTDCPALIKGKDRLLYRLILRRKALFYTVVLIIPTVLMAFLSMMVFYLPSDSGEKITLGISILLSLVVFLLLVSKILPATSSTIPLMAKYLLLTFVFNVVTILVTVIIINIFYRGPRTHVMPSWIRCSLLNILAKILLMRRPKRITPVFPNYFGTTDTELSAELERLDSVNSFYNVEKHSLQNIQDNLSHHPNCVFAKNVGPVNRQKPDSEAEKVFDDAAYIAGLPPECIKAIEATEYLAEHLREKDDYKRHKEDWKYVAMIIDRLLLYIFFGVTIGGTAGVIFSAPHVFDSVDQKQEIEVIKHRYGYGLN